MNRKIAVILPVFLLLTATASLRLHSEGSTDKFDKKSNVKKRDTSRPSRKPASKEVHRKKRKNKTSISGSSTKPNTSVRRPKKNTRPAPPKTNSESTPASPPSAKPPLKAQLLTNITGQSTSSSVFSPSPASTTTTVLDDSSRPNAAVDATGKPIVETSSNNSSTSNPSDSIPPEAPTTNNPAVSETVSLTDQTIPVFDNVTSKPSIAGSIVPADNSDEPTTIAPAEINLPPQPNPESAVPTAELAVQAEHTSQQYQSRSSLIGSSLPNTPPVVNYPKTIADPKFYVANQLITLSLDMDRAKQLNQLMSQYQARTIRRTKLNNLGFIISTFRFPKNSNMRDIIEQIRNHHPQLWVEPNHYYLPQADESSRELSNRRKLFEKINYPSGALCGNDIKIGLLDGPIETSHVSLKEQKIIQKSFYPKGEKLANTSHATAIASLILGNRKIKGLSGILSEATLFSGNVMQRHQADSKKMLATTESILRGLNWLVSKNVKVINLSLGGKRNLLLEIAINKVIEKNISIVAASGNGGTNADPSYPAAIKNVIAVTAIDSKNNIALNAQRGGYIDIAAPGVDLWVASKTNSGKYMSGSSLASPIVAAALAVLLSQEKSVDDLFAQVLDIGNKGRDPVFGEGLLQFSSCQ